MRYLTVLYVMMTVTVVCGAGHEKPATIYHDGWIDLNKNGVKDVYEDVSAPIDKRIDDLLGQMTLNEKTCQMCTLYGYQRVLKDELPTPDWKQEIWKDGIGAIDEHLNGFRNWGLPPQTSEYCWPASKHAWAINEVQKFFIEQTRLGIPVDFTDEGIRGVEAYKATNFPTQLGIGHTWNRALVRRVGEITGQEARALGFTNVYAPILDVGRDQRWGRYEEVYGESPFLVAELGIQMARGLQTDYQVASTAKHYCLYSNNKGAREGFSRVDPQMAPREGESIHLYTFKRVIREAGILGVMSSYNDYDGVPIQGSHYWLTERLRDDFGFKGYVVSDSDAVMYLYNKHGTAVDYKDAVRQSVLAGLNVRCTFRSPESFITPLRELVAEGQVPMAQIDRMVRDVLYVKFKIGLFDQPYVADTKAADEIVYCEAHRAVALQVARESIVLLKNEDHALPLDKRTIKRLAVIGPNADDSRYATTHYGPQVVEVTTVLKGIRDYVGKEIEVLYAKGCEVRDDNWPDTELIRPPLTKEQQAGIDEAVATAQKADRVVMVIGGNVSTCGENSSRTSLILPGRQIELLQAVHKTGKPMVAVVISGRPLAINWTNRNIPAILQAFYPGSEGGRAVAEVLFGDCNPSGKLTVTFPKSAGQIPLNFPTKPCAQYADGSAGLNYPLYYFGHGLSYTQFTYSDLAITPAAIKPDQTVEVSFDVTNTGSRAGDEVVQLYTRDLVSSVTTYEKNLRGFERVSLAAGQTKRISFTLEPEHLQLLNQQNRWVVEPGDFKVMVGGGSEDIRLDGIFAVAETDLQVAAEARRIEQENRLKAERQHKKDMLGRYASVTDNAEALFSAFDGDPNTRWSSSKKGAEMILKIDGADPDQVQIAWYRGETRQYDFEIRYNSGGGQWNRLFAGKSSGKTAEPETYRFEKTATSELKIIFYGNTDNAYSSVSEMRVPGFAGNP